MNFAPFSGQVPTATGMPTIHQFAAKFGYEGAGNTQTVLHETSRYQSVSSGVQFVTADMEAGGSKFRQPELVVVSSQPPTGTVLTGIGTLPTVNSGVKYQTISASSSSVNLGNISYGGPTAYVQDSAQLKPEREKREFRDDIQQELMATMMQQQVSLGQGQQLVVVLHEPKDAAALARALKQEAGRQDNNNAPHNDFIVCSTGGPESEGTWQLTGAGGMPEYLPLSLPLHHLLKYSDPKRDEPAILTLTNALPNVANLTAMPTNPSNTVMVNQASNTANVSGIPTNTIVVSKKKKKKKTMKEKKPKPRPGEIRLTTALDGSTLYCCPECHMAYPEKGLLDQHVVGHTMERRFICDICNAALKRKDHLTRHKQSHNPERPHVCSVCLKAFKRKEQLTLHFVIHSGEKRHVCSECGKGFYRKDHLRKHTRSHIARRVKVELSQTATSAVDSDAS